jgi:hypothetical protein
MTATSPTAPTTPIPPAPPATPVRQSTQTPAPPAATAPPAAASAPWYRRAWVLAVAAGLLAVLSFGSGFVAGNAASLFGGLLGGPGTASFQDGPGSFDGRLPDGSVPGGPGWQSDEQGDGS